MTMAQSTPMCEIPLSNSPTLRGLKLGMSSTDILFLKNTRELLKPIDTEVILETKKETSSFTFSEPDKIKVNIGETMFQYESYLHPSNNWPTGFDFKEIKRVKLRFLRKNFTELK